MSLPVITGVPPETWEQIINILNQMGTSLVQLAEMGITTYEGAGGLKEYLLNNGWELKEVWDLKYMWFHTGAIDPEVTNAVGQYIGNKVAVAGTAGSTYVANYSYGETMLGKIKKGIAIGIVMSLLVSAITDPTMITDLFKNRLDAVLDRFADEDGNIPVMVNKDGKTYFHEDIINAIREELINLGVYESGGFEPGGDISSNISVSEYNGTSTSTSTVTVSDYNFTYPYYIYVPAEDAVLYYNGAVYNRLYMKYNGVYHTPKGYVFGAWNNSSTGQKTIVSMSVYDDDVLSIPAQSRVEYYTDDTYRSWGYMTFYKCWTSDQSKYVVLNNSGPFYYMNETTIAQAISANNIPVAPSRIYANNARVTVYLLNGHTGSGGVEGVDVDEDLISAGVGNIATSLDDIFSTYQTDKVTTMTPNDEDLEHADIWYPISSYNSNIWEDGLTEDESATATDGEVTPDMQDQIADAIKQILEDYYRDPTDPNIINYPEIPVSDSGDTPPANPELLSGSSNGLWAIYNPSISEVQQFGAWLWSSNILDQITRMFNSPIDAVIGFHMIYCTPITGASKTIKAGYLDSPVSAPEVTNQYKDIDCGTVLIPEYYRNALDYDNTRISLFLPFIGIVPLDTAQVMGSSLSILYRIDVLTGTCLAQVSVIKENSNAVMYTYQGNCSVQIPLTATTYTGMVGALLSGISAGASIMTGNIMGAVSAGLEGAMRAGTGLTGVRQSGTLGANAGALGIRIPYVIITHPVSVMPDDFNSLEGLPSAELVPLSSVSGFTRVTYVHLENIPATAQEIEEITGLLQTGVIF